MSLYVCRCQVSASKGSISVHSPYLLTLKKNDGAQNNGQLSVQLPYPTKVHNNYRMQ